MKIAGYEVSKKELEALDHMVPDGRAWIEHAAISKNPDVAIPEKIVKAVALFENTPVAERKPRKQRDEEEWAAMMPTPEQVEEQREMMLVDLHVKLEVAKQKKYTKAQAKLEADIATLEE